MLETLFKIDLILRPLFVTFFIGIITVALLLWYSTWKQTYWKKIGIPYVKPFPVVGSIIENMTVPQHVFELKRYNKYGRIYGHYEGNRPLLTVAEPKILKDILVKDFHAFTGRRRVPTIDKISGNMLPIMNGEDWKRVRTIVTPTFTTGKIKRMIGIFKECSLTLIENFKEATAKGTNIDAKKIYGAFTMDVIASSAFSTKIDSHNDPNNQFVKHARSLFSRDFNWKFAIAVLYPELLKTLRLRVSPKDNFAFFTEVTLQIIEERKKTKQTRNDFLQLLLDTANELPQEGKTDMNEKDDITENYGKEEENDQIFKQAVYTKKTLSKEELIAQCVIFFLAGYETTATTLSFLSYCLALNPEVQEKLIRELDDVLKESNGDLTYEAIQSMKYLDNVISETLRMYPPAVRLERVADEDYKLGETGLIIPKGMIITIPVYAIHRDPENFIDPENFNPDRFTSEERAKRDQFSYIPFGAGPRNCIGMRFALMEMKVCLAYVLSNFRFKRCPQTKVPLEFFINRSLLRPKEIILALEKRNDSVEVL